VHTLFYYFIKVVKVKTHEERSSICKIAHMLSRTTMYSTAEEMLDKVNEYFDQCFAYDTDNKTGKLKRFVVNGPTRAGLVLYLGFSNYKQMRDFVEKAGEQYQEVHDMAITMLEDFLENTLVMSKNNSRGPELALKNICNWEDKSTKEIQAKGTVGMICGWAKDPLKGTVLDAETKKNLGIKEEGDFIDAEVVKKEAGVVNNDSYFEEE